MNWISPSLDKLSLKPNAYRVLSCLLQLLCWKPSRKRPVHSWLVFIWSAGSGLPCSGDTWQILDKSIFQPTAETKHIKPTWGRLKLKHAWWEIWKGPSGNSIKEQSNSLGRCHRRTGVRQIRSSWWCNQVRHSKRQQSNSVLNTIVESNQGSSLEDRSGSK